MCVTILDFIFDLFFEISPIQLQHYRRFGDDGLIVCSSTRLEDVPAADTFTVEDTVQVSSSGPGETIVSVSFEVKFVKSTMVFI